MSKRLTTPLTAIAISSGGVAVTRGGKVVPIKVHAGPRCPISLHLQIETRSASALIAARAAAIALSTWCRCGGRWMRSCERMASR